MKGIEFQELNNGPQQFFQLLPLDWQNEISPFWPLYKPDSKIYILKSGDHIIGGGIVFSKSPPNFGYFENEAQAWFQKGYLYLGFIWVSEPFRNNNLGSYWLSQLRSKNPSQHYFLLTEEEHLHRFYLKNGFSFYKSIPTQDHQEWLYHT